MKWFENTYTERDVLIRFTYVIWLIVPELNKHSRSTENQIPLNVHLCECTSVGTTHISFLTNFTCNLNDLKLSLWFSCTCHLNNLKLPIWFSCTWLWNHFITELNNFPCDYSRFYDGHEAIPVNFHTFHTLSLVMRFSFRIFMWNSPGYIFPVVWLNLYKPRAIQYISVLLR